MLSIQLDKVAGFSIDILLDLGGAEIRFDDLAIFVSVHVLVSIRVRPDAAPQVGRACGPWGLSPVVSYTVHPMDVRVKKKMHKGEKIIYQIKLLHSTI